MRQAARDPYPETEETRTRNKVVIVAVTAAITAVAVAVGIVLMAGSGSSKTGAADSPSTGPTAVLDSHARIACEKLARAATKRKGSGPLDKTQAGIDEFAAQGEAASSNIAELADMAGQGDGDPAVLAQIRGWCSVNWRAS